MPAKYDHIDFTPPSGVKAEARKGLEWRREFGRGGTGVGIARARDLSNGVKISPQTARRMKAFFDRHQSDKTGQGWSPGEKGFPSNGRIAHALWGGDAGYAWSRKLVRQMEAADAARSIREFLEERGFCPTGSGGGIDNSCSSKDGSTGGSDEHGSIPKGYQSIPSLTGGGAVGAYHGKDGPGPAGATHETKIEQDGKGGWKYTSHELGPDGIVPKYDSIDRQGGFKTRDEAVKASSENLPPVNAKAASAVVTFHGNPTGESGGGDKPSPKFSKTPPDGWSTDDESTGSITKNFGTGGPGVNGETHHGFVGYNKYATPKNPEGWTAEVVRLSPRGGESGGKSTSKAGFKTRDEAAAWATTQAASDFGSLNKPRGGGGKRRRSDDGVSMIETRSICLDDFSEDDAFPLLKIERRCCEHGEDGPEETWLVGYAARFGATSLKMDDFYERIDPGAFGIVTERRGRKSPLETRALFNHDPNHLLGRYPSTLRMKVDEQGLRYEIKMPETRRDLVESIERGDIRGSSFSFVISPGGEEWSVEEGRSIRTVKSIASLIDVGPVTFPAYPDASVAVARRSYDEFIRGRAARSAEIEMIRQRKAEIEKFLRERGR